MDKSSTCTAIERKQELLLYGPGPASAEGGPWLRLSGCVCLAPLAGASDYSYRRLCQGQGAASTCTELVSARGIHYSGVEESWRYLQIGEEERPVGIQLFGFDPEDFSFSLQTLLNHPDLPRPDFFDINMGCPVPKVTRTGAGSALMRTPELARKIVETCVEQLAPMKIPLTVKFRRGYGEDEESAPAFAREMIRAGASLITVHGRTRAQQYSGQADWTCIRRVVEAVREEVNQLGRYPVPVLANGDIVDAESALRCQRETGCDGVMIGRAALGNPWIFASVDAAWRGLDAPPAPSVTERVAAIREQLARLLTYRSEATAVRELRKVIGWYLKGSRDASALRRAAFSVQTVQDVEFFCQNWLSSEK